jgi:hypothetical protein
VFVSDFVHRAPSRYAASGLAAGGQVLIDCPSSKGFIIAVLHQVAGSVRQPCPRWRKWHQRCSWKRSVGQTG